MGLGMMSVSLVSWGLITSLRMLTGRSSVPLTVMVGSRCMNSSRDVMMATNVKVRAELFIVYV